MSGSLSDWSAHTSSHARNPLPAGTSPPNTTTARSFGSWSRTDATSVACSASTTTTVASELSMTYCISPALKRYESGTATRLHLRAAWMVVRTSSEFGPHHTSRSPDCAPTASNPFPRRFTCALSFAKVVIDAVAPPLGSTTTAGRSGAVCACTAMASSGAVMDRSVRGAGSVVPVLRSFAVRGVVEGFYGTPWTHEARREVISFLAARGMNAYAYAPKDDARHRAEWRLPYEAAELERFGDLAAHSGALGVRLGFAISPGLDIDYESDVDREALLGKLQPLRDAGVSWFLLLLDDIPMQPGLALRQAALVSWLYSALDGAALTMCPTEYVGMHPSPYLAELGARMPLDVDVMWTGPTVCSPEIDAADARSWTKALGGRRVIVWDNYPVNDALMTASLHLGPYQGRD